MNFKDKIKTKIAENNAKQAVKLAGDTVDEPQASVQAIVEATKDDVNIFGYALKKSIIPALVAIAVWFSTEGKDIFENAPKVMSAAEYNNVVEVQSDLVKSVSIISNAVTITATTSGNNEETINAILVDLSVLREAIEFGANKKFSEIQSVDDVNLDKLEKLQSELSPVYNAVNRYKNTDSKKEKAKIAEDAMSLLDNAFQQYISYVNSI